MSTSGAQLRPQSVLVIGGGVAGLVTLRNLVERGQFDRVELVERRDDVGGVWYLNEQEDIKGDKPKWPSPAYPGLVGNVLPEFLSYSGFPFPEPPTTPHQPFPNLTETEDYLRKFSSAYVNQGKIHLNIEVVKVEELPGRGGWKVILKDWTDRDGVEVKEGKQLEEVWDAVVVCTGWYDDPVWPETEGLEEIKAKGLALHAKWYRGPKGYDGKRVLIIGNGNSSNDIASHFSSVAQSPVYRSIRRPAFDKFVSLPDSRILDVPPVKRYIVQEGGDKFTALLEDGTEIKDIDVVFVGAGYRPNPSFLHVLSNDKTVVPLMSHITPSSPQPRRIPSVHRFILYAYNPSLAFVGANVPHTPFTVADVSSTWLALAWQNEIKYPSDPSDLLVFEKQRIEDIELELSKLPGASSMLSYSFLGDWEEEYAAGLRKEVVEARPELDGVLPRWNKERTELREAMYPVKLKALGWSREQKNRKENELKN